LDKDDKHYDKKVKRIEFLIKKYKTVWEIKQKDLIIMASDRAIFIDQSQSMNIYMSNPTLSKLTSSSFFSWSSGLKTINYYIRSQAISTGAKHLGIDMSENQSKKKEDNQVIPTKKKEEVVVDILPERPADSQFDCFGCSS
jgi:ribonucleotide reductase alpha subunit